MPEKYFTVPEFLTRHFQILQMAVALPAPLSPTAMAKSPQNVDMKTG